MILISPTQDRTTCYALRHEVFVREQGYTAEGKSMPMTQPRII
ncbi:hypothetical protein [Sulfitobacter albidus]